MGKAVSSFPVGETWLRLPKRLQRAGRPHTSNSPRADSLPLSTSLVQPPQFSYICIFIQFNVFLKIFLEAFSLIHGLCYVTFQVSEDVMLHSKYLKMFFSLLISSWCSLWSTLYDFDSFNSVELLEPKIRPILVNPSWALTYHVSLY